MSTKKKHLRHINYKKVNRNLTTEVVKQNIMRSKSHKLSSYHVNKVSLLAFDTKRYICSDNVHTLEHGLGEQNQNRLPMISCYRCT